MSEYCTISLALVVKLLTLIAVVERELTLAQQMLRMKDDISGKGMYGTTRTQ